MKEEFFSKYEQLCDNPFGSILSISKFSFNCIPNKSKEPGYIGRSLSADLISDFAQRAFPPNVARLKWRYQTQNTEPSKNKD